MAASEREPPILKILQNIPEIEMNEYRSSLMSIPTTVLLECPFLQVKKLRLTNEGESGGMTLPRPESLSLTRPSSLWVTDSALVFTNFSETTLQSIQFQIFFRNPEARGSLVISIEHAQGSADAYRFMFFPERGPARDNTFPTKTELLDALARFLEGNNNVSDFLKAWQPPIEGQFTLPVTVYLTLKDPVDPEEAHPPPRPIALLQNPLRPYQRRMARQPQAIENPAFRLTDGDLLGLAIQRMKRFPRIQEALRDQWKAGTLPGEILLFLKSSSNYIPDAVDDWIEAIQGSDAGVAKDDLSVASDEIYRLLGLEQANRTLVFGKTMLIEALVDPGAHLGDLDYDSDEDDLRSRDTEIQGPSSLSRGSMGAQAGSGGSRSLPSAMPSTGFYLSDGSQSTSRVKDHEESKGPVSEKETKEAEDLMGSMDPCLVTFGTIRELARTSIQWMQSVGLSGWTKEKTPTLTINPSTFPLCPRTSLVVNEGTSSSWSFKTIKIQPGDTFITASSLSLQVHTPCDELNGLLKPVINLGFSQYADGTADILLELNAYPPAVLGELVEAAMAMGTMKSEDRLYKIQTMMNNLKKDGWSMEKGSPDDEVGLVYLPPARLEIQSPQVPLTFTTLAEVLGPLLLSTIAPHHHPLRDCWVPGPMDGWERKGQNPGGFCEYMRDLLVKGVPRDKTGSRFTPLQTVFNFHLIRHTRSRKPTYAYVGRARVPRGGAPVREEMKGSAVESYKVAGHCGLLPLGALFKAYLEEIRGGHKIPCLPKTIMTDPKAGKGYGGGQKRMYRLVTAARAFQKALAEAKKKRSLKRRMVGNKGDTEKMEALSRVLAKLGEKGTAGTPLQREQWVSNFCKPTFDPIMLGEEIPHEMKPVAFLQRLGQSSYEKLDCLETGLVQKYAYEAIDSGTPMKHWILRDKATLERLKASSSTPIPNPMNGEGWNPDWMVLGKRADQTPTYYKLMLGPSGSYLLVDKPSVELLKKAVPGNLYQIIPGPTIRYGNQAGSRGVSESHGQVTGPTCKISLVDNFLKQVHPRPLPRSTLEMVGKFLGK